MRGYGESMELSLGENLTSRDMETEVFTPYSQKREGDINPSTKIFTQNCLACKMYRDKDVAETDIRANQ